MLCCGSKKWRWLILWKSWNPHDQLVERIFQILKCWTRELLLLWTRSSRIPSSKRTSVSRSRKPKRRVGFFQHNRSLTWFATSFESLVLMIPFLIMRILFSITLRNDNVLDFHTRWDEILLSMTKIPSDDVLESLYHSRMRESDQLKTVLELYDMEMHQNISMPNYQKLKAMVKGSIDQKLRLRNSVARDEKIETGAVVKSRKGSSGLERGKGICYQWKAKGQCSRGDQCSFRHECHTLAPKSTPKAAPPSELSMTRGGSASRKRSLRGRSQSGKCNRKQCKNFLKGTCTKLPCDF